MTDQQNNQAARHKALIEEVRGIAGLMETAQDPSVITINQVGSLLSRIMNELEELPAGVHHANMHNDVFVTWLHELADYIARQELSGKKAAEQLRKLADEITHPEGRPDQYLESMKLGQIFTGAGQEEITPEPPLLDFLKQLEEQA
ncbi:MAG: hypothetical protein GY727_10130 [Gammaproteobacteria bacterium]|nr:hypothetical protein [Gammaproteobacteria bacterium]MCP4090815.1 hypothetical protein [Gammaproteobacteria bacterium]MCP4277242.1 hypothetical protein [Gammaproteobacteria bacterium]MCP4832864.1 hypothetical protein [Gammaproteobacteria bacterium]MCP4928963.1 hypothetical protein [Gammaproteobacteria bacterium]